MFSVFTLEKSMFSNKVLGLFFVAGKLFPFMSFIANIVILKEAKLRQNRMFLGKMEIFKHTKVGFP